MSIDDQLVAFRTLAYVLTVIGVCLSLLYIFGIPEVKLTNASIKYKEFLNLKDLQDDRGDFALETPRNTTWKHWLTNGAFYIHAFVYMMARMTVNVTMTLTPFYLIHVLNFKYIEGEPLRPEIATVPLASYTTSMLFSLFGYAALVRRFGNRTTPLLIGSVVTCMASVPFLFMCSEISWLVYIAASFQGVGLSIMLNIATSLISDVIGHD